MSYVEQLKGKTPTGQVVDFPVDGQVFLSTTALSGGSAVDTGWIENDGYSSLLYVLRTDQPSATGGIKVDYSDNGATAIPGGATLSYTSAQVNMQIQRALVPKAKYTRITFTNGASAQTVFRFEVRQSTSLIQPTEGSLNVPMTDTALALYTVSDIQLTDGSSYDRIQRTGNALNVQVTGGSIASTSPQPTTETTAAFTSTNTASDILAANTNRKGASFTGISGTVYLRVGGTATTTLWRVKLNSGTYFELPKPANTARISVIGSGVVNVTEES